MQKESYLTPSGLRQLQAELDHLKSFRRNEVARRIQKANESGGAMDNAEYEEAKNEQAFVEGRIINLESILGNAIVTPNSRKFTERITIGSSVTVESDYGAKQNYRLVGSAEAAPLEGKISNESPVGQALIGHRVGDEVDVYAPSGVTRLRIIKIR